MQLLDILVDGILGWTWWQIVLYTLATTHITIVAVTVYLHRYSAHRSLDLHPVVSHFFRFWLWLTTGMVTREWTAVHRKHHARCETSEDPHSPVLFGIRKVLLEGVELYRISARDEEMLDRYGKGCPDDWIERNLYSGHCRFGIFFLMAVQVLAFGPLGLTVWAVQMLWIPFFAAGVINGIGHYWGYRNFETPDASVNIVPWGILIGGEELHNNHHTYPNSARLSSKPWEFDIGWAYIRALSLFGLARPLHHKPLACQEEGREVVDMDTVRGVLNDRFHVMAHFSENVIDPLVRKERDRADCSARRRLLKPAARLLARDERLLGRASEDQQRVQQILQTSEPLRTIYELRKELQEFWAMRGHSAEKLLQTFTSWLEKAEATGISVLHDFVCYLKSYTLPEKASA